jgi:hypothetical protein
LQIYESIYTKKYKQKISFRSSDQVGKSAGNGAAKVFQRILPEQFLYSLAGCFILLVDGAGVAGGAFAQSESAFPENILSVDGLHNMDKGLIQLVPVDIKSAGGPF